MPRCSVRSFAGLGFSCRCAPSGWRCQAVWWYRCGHIMGTLITTDKRRRGRPARAEAAALDARILRAATEMFLRDGYGATSMEAVAAAAAVSKPTLYARHADKPALFGAAVAALIAAWRAPFDAALTAEADLAAALRQAGREMLRAALAPDALALYRLIVAESGRFPEIIRSLAGAGAQGGIAGVAALLARHGVAEPYWAAEQFQRLIIGGPQARALGFGPSLSEPEQTAWVEKTVTLFLQGLNG